MPCDCDTSVIHFYAIIFVKGEEIIAVLPWEDWWDLQVRDDAHAHVALLPLRSDVRARFNATAAWEHAREMDGKPYGYHNMIFSWIDTVTDNFPAPIDAHLVFGHCCSLTHCSLSA